MLDALPPESLPPESLPPESPDPAELAELSLDVAELVSLEAEEGAELLLPPLETMSACASSVPNTPDILEFLEAVKNTRKKPITTRRPMLIFLKRSRVPERVLSITTMALVSGTQYAIQRMQCG